jgi:hypothetical protein
MGVCRGEKFDALSEPDRARTRVRRAGRREVDDCGRARALTPGCRVDTMLILEGEQGLMKSTALRTLGGEWFSDARLDFSNKDTLLLLQGRWIIEMPELEGMNKADTSETKRFLTQHEDIFRPPYGQKLTKSPRRCIFAGTVNHETYLKDDSGNRRFWPVRVTSIDLDALARDRDQLWGEAVRLFRDGVPFWVKAEERSLSSKNSRTSGSRSMPGRAPYARTWRRRNVSRSPGQGEDGRAPGRRSQARQGQVGQAMCDPRRLDHAPPGMGA